MKLSQATAGQVVRNDHNGSYYRYERPDGDRSRIWPLESFPNGLLIPKTAPTLVSADLEVAVVGEWHDEFSVGVVLVGKQQERKRDKYQAELDTKRLELAILQAEYEDLPVDGVGKQSRGSWANKIKAVETRIFNIERGLAEHTPLADMSPRPREATGDTLPPAPAFGVKSVVQVPSGRPAVVLDMALAKSGQWMAQIGIKLDNGAALVAALPCEVLRPWALSRVGTV